MTFLFSYYRLAIRFVAGVTDRLLLGSSSSSTAHLLLKHHVSHNFDFNGVKCSRMPFLEVGQISVRLAHCGRCGVHGLARVRGLQSCACGFHIGLRAGSKHALRELVNYSFFGLVALFCARRSKHINVFNGLHWGDDDFCLGGGLLFALLSGVSRGRGDYSRSTRWQDVLL